MSKFSCYLTVGLTLAALYLPPSLVVAREALPALETGAHSHLFAAVPKWVDTPADVPLTARKDPVVVRLAETQVRVGKEVAMFFNRAIQVNERSALSSIGQFGIDYIPEYQKLTLHRVAIIRDGQVLDHSKDVGIRHLQREVGMEAGSYVGDETVQLLLNDVRVGDTLWISYSIDGSNPVFGKYWNADFSWDGADPIELRRVSVSYPVGQPLAWRQLGDFRRDAVTPQQAERGGMHYLRFEGHGLDAVQMEANIPSDYLPVRALEFSEYPDWRSVAQWAQTLFPKVTSGPALTALAEKLATEPTPVAQAAAALHWVQREVRYFSVSMGENSHRPQPPEEVLKRRYGDCKDKSYLLVSLLARLGIEAHPVLVSARAPRMPFKTLATTTWFDHVIVRIRLDGQTYYVDPTRAGQTGQLERLPKVLPGAAGLPVAAGSDALVSLPPSKQTEPDFEHVEHISIASMDGDATLELHKIYRDRYAEWARERYASLSAAELKKSALAAYEKQYHGVTMVGEPQVIDDAALNRVDVITRYTLPKPVELKDQRYSIAFETKIVADSIDLPDNLTRNFPFELSDGENWSRYRAQIDWPPNVRLAGRSVARTVDNSFFRVDKESVLMGNRVDYLLDYRFKKSIVEPAEMQALHTEGTKLEGMTAGRFIVDGAYVRPESTSAISFRMMDAADAAVAVGQSLGREAKKQPVASEEACDVVMVALRLPDLAPGFGGQAYRQLKAAVEAKDASMPERQCYARILYGQGQFTAALALWHDGVGGTDGGEASRLAAWARWYAGDTMGALEAMDRYAAASAAAFDGANYRMAQAERIALYQRAGRPVPDELMQQARAVIDGPWPRPILAMQAGVISQEALLQLVAALPADAAAIALPEAWYYIGHRLAADGDQAAARRAFKRSVSLALRSSSLGVDAQVALAQLLPADAEDEAARRAVTGKEYVAAVQHWSKGAMVGMAASQRQLGSALIAGSGGPKDPVQGAKWLTAAALQDDEVAQFLLGLQLGATGKDNAESLRWLRASAEQGYPPAQYELSERMANGIGMAADPIGAAVPLTMAADQGYAEAEARLGYRLQEGIGGVRSYPVSLFWSSLAVDQGNTMAQVNLGLLYENGNGAAQDYAHAVKLYTAAAEQGDAVGATNLGWMYAAGHGVPRDDRQAAKWYRVAAAKNFSRAQTLLGWAYDTGTGVPRDEVEAQKWYLLAAEQGDAQAQYNVAYNYEYGIGTKPDGAVAFQWYQKAAAQGRADACHSLASFYATGRGMPRDLLEALKWHRKAAALGNVLSLNNLGLIYENGEGVPKDFAAATSWYRKGAEAGNAYAQANLADLLASGHAGAPDKVSAYQWWQLALRNSQADEALRQRAKDGLATLQSTMASDEIAAAKLALSKLPNP